MPIILALLLLLSACASPAPDFFGAARHDTVIDGIRFSVFHKGNEAEVVRLGYLGRNAHAAVPALMVRAAEETTGCAAAPDSLRSRIPGDTGEARIALRC
ncbi:hypothetical protein [Paracoccus cavernae]|uniref:hypothetical protein n=1 Tax=Paracoccus cavernae TaxID=1571207 RepID=UPI0035F30C99